jgi:integrase
MAYQRGAIRRIKRKDGEVWMLRFREGTADGGRRERVVPIGFVRDFPKERDARKEVDRRGLLVEVNSENQTGRIRFDVLAEFYLKVDFGPDAVRPKSSNTIPITQHIVRSYLIQRWGDQWADDIKPLDIQRWLQHLHAGKGLAWPTLSKMRGIMSRIYRVGLVHERVSKNPVEHVQTRSKSNYRAIVMTPDQTIAIVKNLISPLHQALILTCAATALRSSEILALRWYDVRWPENRIRVSKRWAGGDGETKTAVSDGYVPMHPALAVHLRQWQSETPYGDEADFVFPSMKMNGKIPLSSSVFVRSHLRPAAIKAGVQIARGQRFGLHNLRHSLSHWLVNQGKVAPKTVQGLLRHSRVQTTLDLYTQEDCDETRAAQGQFLTALGMPTGMVQ